MVVFMPYVLIAAVVILIALRLFSSRKQGATAVKFEVIYLLVYAFFGGILCTFLLTAGMGIMGVLILITFMGGFIMRLVPLFRLIQKVEDEMAGRTTSRTGE